MIHRKSNILLKCSCGVRFKVLKITTPLIYLEDKLGRFFAARCPECQLLGYAPEEPPSLERLRLL